MPIRKYISSGWRQAGVLLALVLGTWVLLDSVHAHYPLQKWLFFRYAVYWLIAGMWSLSCLAAGHVAVRALLGRSLPLVEHVTVAFAFGVLAFQLALFVTGVAGLYGPVLFVALPAVFLAIGGVPTWRLLRAAARHARARGLLRPRFGPLAWMALAYGLLCLVALYLPVMLPANSSYDARWRHVTMAEQYVLHGGIRRFPEGWALGTGPQFTPLLYAWGFMLPKAGLFNRIELCAHLEYVVFLWTTLAGIPALVRRLVPKADPSLVWTARFVFPGVFLYDSNLSVGADHIGAVFAAPLFLIGLRAWRSMDWRKGALLGAFIAAAACAKETTLLLLAPAPVIMVVVRFALDAAGSLRRWRQASVRLLGSAVAGVTTLALTAPYWLKNLLWYGDPLYPSLAGHFTPRPFDAGAAYAFEHAFRGQLWSPTKDLDGLWQATKSLVTFSFHPHAWWTLHRDVPVFGSLFTLLLLALPFVPKARRIWALVAWVHLALFAWYWVHHEERHLQVLVPWMAAVVAAICVAVWRLGGKPLRGLLAVLVGTQIVWGSDVYFFPTHTMVGTSPIKAVADLLGMGHQGQYDQRLDFQRDQVALGAALPRDAVLLVHERRDHLGIGRVTVTDFYGDQIGIDYAGLGSPDRIYRHLRGLGVTHVAWRDEQSLGYAPLAGDILFFEFAERHTRGLRRVGSYWLGRMPERAPKPPVRREVAVLGCPSHPYATGIYRLSDLRVPQFGPLRTHFPAPRSKLTDEAEWAKTLRAVVIDSACDQRASSRVRKDFQRVARRQKVYGRPYEIWLRRKD